MADSIFPDDINAGMDNGSNEWIKASEFEGDGLKLKALKVEKVKASNPQYGAEEDDLFVEREVLKVGETLRYNFLTPEGTTRKIDSTSVPLFVGFKKADIKPEDWVHIQRSGQAKQTRYTVEKIEAPTKAPTAKKAAPMDYPEEDINPADIPF